MTRLTVVYHQRCEASLEFVGKTRKFLETHDIEYIDIATEEFESAIEIDVVPILVQGNMVFKGKEAFDRLEQLDKGDTNTLSKTKKSSGSLYSNLYIAPPETGKEKKVTFDK